MLYPLNSGYSMHSVCAQRGVKHSVRPSFTAVGQPSHLTADDQCQTGKVTGLTSDSTTLDGLEIVQTTLQNWTQQRDYLLIFSHNNYEVWTTMRCS